MDINELIEHLSLQRAYPHPVDTVDVRQTHISVVFLAGNFAYKIRKPVRLGFLDFSTLDRRRHDCEEEVRLNRRLAPAVYLGIIPVAHGPDGLRFDDGDQGEVVEWAVKMLRLPEGTTFLDRLRRGELTPTHLDRLSKLIAEFHRQAAGGERAAEFGRLEVVTRNARENFTESEPDVGITVSREVFDRLRELTEQYLHDLGSLIEARAARGVPRDTHGDLHLDHVYLLPDQPPPHDLVVIDCIEFNERFRFADPIADAAFLVMDLKFHGQRELANRMVEEYLRESGDAEGRTLVPFYSAYRAVIRAKVEGLTLREPEVPLEARETNRRRAQGHWLLALGELERPGRRPGLVLVGGLPGTGKSTLAREFVADGFVIIRSDEVRKELVPADLSRSGLEDGAYSPEWSARVYAECLKRAESELLVGRRVIVDANFREDAQRSPFIDLAHQLAIPFLFVVCQATPERIRERIANRRDDPSEADWAVYEWAASRWEPPITTTISVATESGVGPAVDSVRTQLREIGLLD